MRLIAILLASFIPCISWSQDIDIDYGMKGWYLGGGAGIANVYSWTDYGWGSADYGDSDAAYTITGGYRFMPYFAVEAAWLDSGTPTWNRDLVYVGNLLDVYNVDASIDLSAYQVSAVGILPFAKIWEVYIRGGASVWDGTSSQVLTRVSDGQVTLRTIDDTGVSFLLGVGAGVKLGHNWQIRVDYSYYGIQDDLLVVSSGDSAYTDFGALQVVYRFGDDW